MTAGRRKVLTLASIAIAALAAAPAVDAPVFVWNRTPSAPIGLYLRVNRAPSLDGWALLSANSGAARWIAANGFLEAGWPIVKRVRAVAADEICRLGEEIRINGSIVAIALAQTDSGVTLPSWSGCRVLAQREFFLLNDHKRSLDGRYFGATPIDEIDGSLLLLFKAPSRLR